MALLNVTSVLCGQRSDKERPQSVGADVGETSAGDDEIHRLRPFALLIGLHVEGDALALGQRFEPGTLNRGDVNEDIASAVIRRDEAVAALGVEELHCTFHGHREAPIPMIAPPSAPAAR